MMDNLFSIMQPSGEITQAEPIPGKWYVGMTFAADAASIEHGIKFHDGEFGEYVAEGEFVCEDWTLAENPSVDMGYYDFIQLTS